ncbi:solute carrier family 12 member 9 [Condylostylus longicornis]|uniref:solute carrier family 12 member 9 n=1 Tax=Condylostylus longicornis TaxID=2530218 RepID=UPI00244DBACF|nr:solute carrier family 12 member 9 [Condylostylus longicornis]
MISQRVESDSINGNINPRDETIPITSGGVLRNFGGIFGMRNSPSPHSADGYVEFGMAGNERSSARTLGTFAGVFSPVALSMFSALVFIRVGYIVGNAGLYITLAQFLIAYAILLFTVASVCAISTNGAVEGGGVYFMISRTLGPEFGGSIGTLFFLANVVGSAMAISGCAEGIIENFGPGGYSSNEEGLIPDGKSWRFLYCSLINTCMLIVCLIGAAMFAKTSVIILAIVCVCLFSTYVSFLTQGPKEVSIPQENTLVQNITKANYTGLSLKTLHENLYQNYSKDYTSNGNEINFAKVFGVLFAGVTGIMAGANMSGELKNPGRSIPIGTLSAVAFTFTSYIILCLLMAATTSRFLMQNNYLFLMPVNVWPGFTAIGILTATFSTALSNLIGSSRILEALAKDQVFGQLLNFITKGTWKGNPIVAVVVSFVLVEIILLIGSLNTIAQVNSVLFMLSYLATNLACLGIELTGAPNFRPLFKYFTWHTCFIGLIGTLTMMFVINPIYASLSIILCLVLVIALHIFSPASQGTQWGSISQALMFHQVRKYLLMLDSRKDHVKFWRPQMLLLVSSPRSCCPLIDFVNDLKKGGLYVIGHVKIGDGTQQTGETDPSIEENKMWLSFLDHMKVKAFAEVTIAKTIREGVQHLIRLSGIGAMKPNTIIFGFYDEEASKDFLSSTNSLYKTTKFNENDFLNFPIRKPGEAKNFTAQEYVALICDTLRMKKNVCLCRHFHMLDKYMISKSNHIKYIDVWPINAFNPKNDDPFDVVSLFMMQLACIINMLPKWKRLSLRVFLCKSDNQPDINYQNPSYAKLKLEKQLNQLRINANIYEINDWDKFTKFENPDINDELASNEENIHMSKFYIQRVNQVIRDKSNATAVSFIYLPAPPTINTENWESKSQNYLDLLNNLTNELPPTILVHGVSPVTSTTL